MFALIYKYSHISLQIHSKATTISELFNRILLAQLTQIKINQIIWVHYRDGSSPNEQQVVRSTYILITVLVYCIKISHKRPSPKKKKKTLRLGCFHIQSYPMHTFRRHKLVYHSGTKSEWVSLI